MIQKLFIDIGGTHLRSEVWIGSDVVAESIPSRDIGLLSYIDRVMQKYPDISFIGISYAGQVNEGILVASPNINIDEYDIVTAVKMRYGIPVKIDNDLNCAIRAEAAYWESDSIAALFIGTGIGSAVIDQGKLVAGSRNMAFEIGHIPYRDTPLICGCGRSNCIELFASGSGITKWLTLYGRDQKPNLEQLKKSQLEDERSVAAEFERAVLHAAGVLVTLVNPEILVLGGGIVEQNPYLVSLIRENLKEYALKPSLNTLRIEKSVLENAPLSGAKLLENSNG
jgi:glucokinase